MRSITTADLTRSLRSFGPILPRFTCRGVVIDGRRREEICAKHGVDLRTAEIPPSQVKPLLWMLHPERITRADYPALQGGGIAPAHRAAVDCWSDAGTIAAWWLQCDPQADGSRWQRLHAAFGSLLAAADEGTQKLTPEKLIELVRKTL